MPKRLSSLTADLIPDDKNATIYALCDPDTGEIRYVGKTTDPHRRLVAHRGMSEATHLPVKRWIAKLARAGKEPDLRVIERCSADWPERERFWIAHYRAAGARLANLCDGGSGGGYRHSAAARQKISAARTGMRFSEEHRAKLSARKRALYAAGTATQDRLSRYYAAIDDDQVQQVRMLAEARTYPQRVIAAMFGIPQSTVSEIKKGTRYKHAQR